MTDSAREIIWGLMGDAYDSAERHSEGLSAILDTLAAAENREALTRWLIDAGVLVHAECWDAPDVTEDQIEEAEAEKAHLQRSVDDSEESWQVYAEAADRVDLLRDVHDRTTVYYEDEDRPDDAVPLFKVRGS